VAKPEWADRIAALRKYLGLLQTQFAELFGVTQAAVSQWENGHREPSGDNYLRMGNLADEANCIWFWQRAGVDVDRIERLAAARKSPSKKTPKN
jgi:transcriptional regulator with XRE-family HTH domain